jgi:hypothetical protein
VRWWTDEKKRRTKDELCAFTPFLSLSSSLSLSLLLTLTPTKRKFCTKRKVKQCDNPPKTYFVVYYESIKRELKTRPLYGCRCYERLKTKGEESTRLSYTGSLGEPEHLQVKTRLNRRDVCECDGWVCVLEVIGVPSRLRLTHKTTTLVRVLPTFPF